MGIVIEARLHDRGRVLLEDYLAQAHVLVVATGDEQVRLASTPGADTDEDVMWQH